MRSLRLAFRDIINEAGWIALFGIVMSIVAYALIRTIYVIMPVADENAAIERFADKGASVVCVDTFPYQPKSSMVRLPNTRFDFSIPDELRASLGEDLSQGKAGTFVTLWEVPMGCGDIPAEQTVVFLGAYADLTKYERDQASPVALAVSRDLADYAGKVVAIGGSNVKVGLIPEDMDIYHPLYYHRPEEVALSYPKTVFVFIPNYELACEVLPGLVDANLLDRLTLFNPSENEVADLRKEILVNKGMLTGVRTIEQQMGILEQAGNRAHASYLVYFLITVIALIVALAASLYRSLSSKVPVYVIHHIFGASLREIRVRMALFSMSYLIAPMVVAAVLLRSAGMMTPCAIAILVTAAAALVGVTVLLIQKQVGNVLGEGVRIG